MRLPKNDRLLGDEADGDLLTFNDLDLIAQYAKTTALAQATASIGTALNSFGLRWTDATAGYRDVVLQPGRINITPAGVARRAEWSPGAQFVVAFVDVAKIAERAVPGVCPDEIVIRTVTAETDSDISELVVTLAREAKRTAFDQSLQELSTLLVRRHATVERVADRLSTEERMHIVRQVDSQLEGGCSVERLARSVGYSRTHFARLFKAAFGTSVHRFVVDRRVERAHFVGCR